MRYFIFLATYHTGSLGAEDKYQTFQTHTKVDKRGLLNIRNLGIVVMYEKNISEIDQSG